jgi:hypothetical protein
METFESLKSRGQQLERFSVSLGDWMKENLPQEGSQGNISELERIGREIRGLQRAVERPASVVMFGESQVGKSYLVHNIAKNRVTDRLEILSGQNEVMDFLRDVNPIGEGNEATGIVTRFTVSDPGGDTAFPFRARLLTQLDIAAIASNSYCLDLQGQPVNSADHIRAVLSSLPPHGDAPSPGMTLDEIDFFIEYCHHRFSGAAYFTTLEKSGFFEEIRRTFLYRTDDERLKVLSFLWGGIPFWSEFVEQAWRTLARLGHAQWVHLPTLSISPNSHTVVGVGRIYELYDPTLHAAAYSMRREGAENQPWEVQVFANGKATVINRGILSILLREVVLRIEDSIATEDRSFLKECDLLDFPGARSRLQVQVETFCEEPDSVYIVRGKVAYLFDLYNRELEIGVLVLCVPEKQSEVASLPNIAAEWISRNCGENAHDRLGRRRHLEQLLQGSSEYDVRLSPLLTAFTKFNLNMLPANEHLNVGSDSISEGFSNRFRKNFQEFFEGRVADKWITKWDDEGYHFVFPIRDPQWSGRIFNGYTKDLPVEAEVRPEIAGLLSSMEREFLQNGDVQRILTNPREVWRELTTPNSTGTHSFMRHLSPVANPAIKIAKVHAKLEEYKTKLIRLAEPHFRSGDINEELRKAQEKGLRARIGLGGMLHNNSNLVIRLMKEFMCREEDAHKAYYEVYRELVNPVGKSDITWRQVSEILGVSLPEECAKPAESMAAQLGLPIHSFLEMLERDGISIPSSGQGSFHVEKQERFAQLLMTHWFRRISNWRGEDQMRNAGGSVQHTEYVSLLIEALELGVERTHLKALVAAEVEVEFAQPTPSNQAAVSAGALSTRLVNRYARSCGWELVTEIRPAKTTGDEIFRRNSKGIASIEEIRPHSAGPSAYWEDWVWGLHKSFEQNVLFTFQVRDARFVEANERLGSIIDSIQQA